MNDDVLDQLLSRTVKKLITNEIFLGLFTMQLKREWTDTKLETAGVYWTGDDYMLLVNRAFFSKMNDFERYCVIKHEMLHLAMYHTVDFKGLQKEDHETFNIAADMAVNQYVKDIDKLTTLEPCTIDSIAKKLGKQPTYFPKDQGVRTYYKLIRDAKKQKNGNGQGQGGGQLPNVNNHNGWGSGDDQNSNTNQQIMDNLKRQCINGKLKQADSQCANGRGTLPAELEAILDGLKIKEPPVFNWAAYVRQFIQTSLKTHRISSRHKLNMRYEEFEELFPGHRRKRDSQILVAVDTSGSVSDVFLEKFWNQMVHINKTTDIDVIECDAEAYEPFPFDKHKPFKISGRGGTDFQPVIDYYVKNKRKYGCLIYFTDGECPAPNVPAFKGSILWVTYGSYLNEDLNKVGRMIHVEEKDY